MAKEIKFPNGGYIVKVIRKEDVINSIEDNITDKEVALELIKQLEIDAADFLNNGRWTGIPNLGNFRVPPAQQYFKNKQQNKLLHDAKELLDSNDYILFRKQINVENKLKVKAERYYKYICSIAANHNRKLYKQLVINYGAVYARLKLFFGYTVTAIDNEFEINEND